MVSLSYYQSAGLEFRSRHRYELVNYVQPTVMWDLLSGAGLEKQDKSSTGQEEDWFHAPHGPLAGGIGGLGSVSWCTVLGAGVWALR